MRDHIYSFDEVAVGGNLSSLIYSYTHNIPVVINDLNLPHRFETMKAHSKLELWKKLYFLLSLSGLNLLGDKTQHTRIKDENTLSVSTTNSRLVRINFDKLIVFDDEKISGLPLSVEELYQSSSKFLILDWMIARPCMEHDFVHFHTGDEFVKDIHFYPTERMTGIHPRKKDVVAISYLTEEQLQDFEYSDTYARFKTTKIMGEHGITGRKNGYANGKQIHYALKLEVTHREVRKQRMGLYNNVKNIEFNYSAPEDFLNKQACKSYQSKLNEFFKII